MVSGGLFGSAPESCGHTPGSLRPHWEQKLGHSGRWCSSCPRPRALLLQGKQNLGPPSGHMMLLAFFRQSRKWCQLSCKFTHIMSICCWFQLKLTSSGFFRNSALSPTLKNRGGRGLQQRFSWTWGHSVHTAVSKQRPPHNLWSMRFPRAAYNVFSILFAHKVCPTTTGLIKLLCLKSLWIHSFCGAVPPTWFQFRWVHLF